LYNINIDEEHPVTLSFVDKLLSRYLDLAELATHSSVDPVRVDKVTYEVCEALFTKVDAYTNILVSMEKMEQDVQSFGDIHA
jgi:hypothetical protein